MPDQRLALIALQKRMLDDDLPRRTVAVLASGVAALLFLSPAQVTLYLGSYFLADLALTWALSGLVAEPQAVWRLRLVQAAAFAAMSAFLMPVAMLWDVPGVTPKIGAMIHAFGGMLSIMLVRTAFLPMTVANSLPLAGLVVVLAVIERGVVRWQEQMFLGFAVTVLAGYFVLTLLSAQRINRELARARDAALARVETQKRFLATMSHELRTPLNGILGTAQALAASHPGLGAETIRDSARDMAAMVDDLLDNAAIEAGALRINRQPVRLAELMGRIEARWRPLFAAKGLTLRVTLAADLPQAMMIDPLRLSQGVSNLLANALRLTSVGGVSVDLGRVAVGIEAVITDSGPGFPEGAEPRLFQPFEAIALPDGVSGPNASGPSTGLGLSISRGLARAMGGDLVFERPEAGGSRFRLTLAAPEAEAAPPPDNAEDPTPGVARLRGPRVLVVDDIATNRLVLRLLLARAGAQVSEAASGAAAVEMLADPGHALPDAVLMDIRMPGLSGFETLARLRGAGIHCPVIAVSADVAPAERAEAMAHGFDGYLTKPIEEVDLHAALLRVLPAPARL